MTPLIYGMSASGNCYKIQLALALLNLPYRWEEVDILTGATREPDFLARNPNGRVPTAEVAPGQFLAESNAILLYFGEGTTLVPEQRWPRATLFQWLFFEQYSHEPYIAVARFINRFLPPDHPRRSELPQLIERGHEALGVMEKALETQPYLVGDTLTLADIALYAYSHTAGDNGFDLESYPAVTGWLERVRQQPGFVPMQG